jgi:hypothetical protein
MQRWILIGVAALLLVLATGVFGYWQYRQNRAEPIWVPIPLNKELPLEQRDEMVKKLKIELCQKDRLVQVSKELKLTEKFSLPSDEAVAAELTERLFVKVGEFKTATVTIPTLDIGVDGAHKDSKTSAEIAQRMVQEVWKILGVKPPTAP